MHRISTNTSLFWKIFLPTFWFSFYGIFTIVVWAYSQTGGGIVFGFNFRIAVTLFYIIGSFLIYFTIMTIKRVEYKEEYLYVSNYFRTIRIPFALIKRIDIKDYTIFRRGKIYLHKDTPFGKKLVFLVSTRAVKQMKIDFPQFFDESQIPYTTEPDMEDFINPAESDGEESAES